MQAFITLGILALLFPVHTSNSEISFTPQIVKAQEVSIIETATSSIPDLIDQYALKYGVSSTTMYKVIDCETGGTFDPLIQSYVTKNGKRENSWGLAQINLPSWPDITKTQAQDPDFAIDFLASKLKEKKGGYWTCYRNLPKLKLNH